MSSLQYCDQCEVAIPKVAKIFHTRDRKILCACCHDDVVQHRKERAHRYLEQKSRQNPVDHQKILNLAIGVVIVLVVGGFFLLMSNRTEEAVAKQVPSVSGERAPADRSAQHRHRAGERGPDHGARAAQPLPLKVEEREAHGGAPGEPPGAEVLDLHVEDGLRDPVREGDRLDFRLHVPAFGSRGHEAPHRGRGQFPRRLPAEPPGGTLVHSFCALVIVSTSGLHSGS